MLKVEKISLDYGNGKGVNNISFQIKKGKILALLGSNGSGKTTMFRILLGLLKEEEGSIYYEKERLDKENYRLFGYIPEERSLLRQLSVKEHVYYLARLKKMEDSEIDYHFSYWSKYLHIDEYKNYKIIELSKGNQQKVQILCALIHNPEIIIFDEPLNGLDIENVELFKKLLMKLKNEKKIILISSHQYQNIEHFCDYVVYLNEGKILFKGDIQKLKAKYKKRILSIHTKKDLFKKDKSILSSIREKEYQIIEVIDLENAYRIIKQLEELNIEDFKMEMISLNEIIKENLV